MSNQNLDQAVQSLAGIISTINDNDLEKIKNDRDSVFEKFKNVFSSGEIGGLTPENFRSFLYFKNNRHWSNLYRRGLSAANDMDALRNSLAILLDKNVPIENKFEQAIENINGLGKSIATAILTIAYPDQYGVWNSTSEEGLKNLGIFPVFDRGMKIGQKYREINTILTELKKQLKIDFWTLDWLWTLMTPQNPSQTTQSNNSQINSPQNTIYYGPPGTGKTFELKKKLKEYKDYKFVTFHQSYSYEDFIEGLRPVLGQQTNANQVHYEICKGVFLKLCERARKDENNRYAILIDEINRSNISKIFGELITLIELDKREKADQATCATLTYSGTSFSVPANVDIIGSMNTADRSIALVDTALRRRFDFIPMFPNTDYGGPLDELTVKVGDTIIDIQELLKTINLRVERLYDRDHTIGHAYFLSLKNKDDDKDLKDDDKDLKVVTVNQSDGQKLQKSNQCSNPRFDELKRIFSKRILPLLEEYFFDNWEKIRLVLGDNQKKKDDHQFIKEDKKNLADLFGKEFNQESIPKRYYVNDNAFDDPESYRLIYGNP